MASHARGEWQKSTEPVTGPAFPDWDLIELIVIHYPGSDWADMDFDNDGDVDLTDTVTILRAMQHAYLTDPSRGYSLGYGIGVDVLGDDWEIRGFDIHNAANKGAPEKSGHKNWNDVTISVLVIQRGNMPAGLDQVDGVRRVIARIWQAAGRQIPVGVHMDGDYTPCAGVGITAQVRSGELLPQPDPIPDPGPGPDPSPEDEMIKVRFKGYNNVFLLGSGGYAHITIALDKFYKDLPLVLSELHSQGLKSALTQCGLKMSDMVPSGEPITWVGTPLT